MSNLFECFFLFSKNREKGAENIHITVLNVKNIIIKKMEIEEKIKKLAEKVQLEIKKEEMPIYLETIKKLEKFLANFQKVKLSEKTLPLTRINVGYLTKKDLEKITEKTSRQKSIQPNNYYFHVSFKKN